MIAEPRCLLTMLFVRRRGAWFHFHYLPAGWRTKGSAIFEKFHEKLHDSVGRVLPPLPPVGLMAWRLEWLVVGLPLRNRHCVDTNPRTTKQALIHRSDLYLVSSVVAYVGAPSSFDGV